MGLDRAKQPKPATQAKPGARTADGTRGNSGLQSKLGPQTRAVHGGEPERHGVNGPVVTEIIRTSTFTFSNTEEMKEWAEGKNKAYIFTRYGNPTLSVAEKKIAPPEARRKSPPCPKRPPPRPPRLRAPQFSFPPRSALDSRSACKCRLCSCPRPTPSFLPCWKR